LLFSRRVSWPNRTGMMLFGVAGRRSAVILRRTTIDRPFVGMSRDELAMIF